jgi:hypothetical protein
VVARKVNASPVQPIGAPPKASLENEANDDEIPKPVVVESFAMVRRLQLERNKTTGAMKVVAFIVLGDIVVLVTIFAFALRSCAHRFT